MRKTPARPGTRGRHHKPIRFRVGIGLLITYPVMYLVAAAVVFLPLQAGVRASLVAGILVAAEVIVLLGIACVGKETYQAIKAKLLRRRSVAHDETLRKDSTDASR